MPEFTDFKPNFYQLTQHKAMYSGALYNSVHADVFPESPEVSISSLGVSEPAPSLVTLRPPTPGNVPRPQSCLYLWPAATDAPWQTPGFVTVVIKKKIIFLKHIERNISILYEKSKEVSLKGRFNS